MIYYHIESVLDRSNLYRYLQKTNLYQVHLSELITGWGILLPIISNIVADISGLLDKTTSNEAWHEV